MIETYKQLPTGTRMARHYYALACRQVLEHPKAFDVFMEEPFRKELEAVVERAKKEGNL